MSPDIRWRNGGPLMIGGQVGGSENCCCENPPPPSCNCIGICVHSIGVDAPAQVSVGQVVRPCDKVGVLRRVEAPFWLTPPWVESYEYSPFASYGEASVSLADSLTLEAKVVLDAVGKAGTQNVPGGGERPLWFSISAYVGLKVYCDSAAEYRNFRAGVQFFVFATVGVATVPWDEPTYSQGYLFNRHALLTVPTECIANSNASCVPLPANARVGVIPTPLSVTINKDTTSLGDYYDHYENASPTPFYGDAAKEIGEYIRDNLSATFTIKSRSNCNPVECSCGVALSNNVIRVVFEGKEFVMGTEDTISETDQYFETWTHEAPGTFVYRKNNLSNTETYLKKEVAVFCQTDDAASPPVDRWYAACLNWCIDEANYSTTYAEDYFIGYFECQPANDCQPFGSTSPIPLGSPIDVERVDGWPIGSGCTVPGFASITLSQICS